MANIKNVMEDEQALALLNNGLVKVDKYKKVINKILQGSSEASACKKYRVDVARFRRFLRTEYMASQTEPVKFEFGFFTWEDKIMHYLTGRRDVIAYDGFKDAWEQVKSTLTPRQKLVIEYRLEEDLTQAEIARALCISREAVRQMEERAKSALRHPSKLKTLMFGLSYMDSEKELRIAVNKKHSETCVEELKRVEEELNNLFLSVANTVVEDLDIHIRTYNCLKRTNLNTIGDILAYVRDGNKLKDIRNFGAVSLGELNEALSKVVERKVTLRKKGI